MNALLLVVAVVALVAYFYFSNRDKREKVEVKRQKVMKRRQMILDAARRVLPPESEYRQRLVARENEGFWTGVAEKRKERDKDKPEDGLKY